MTPDQIERAARALWSIRREEVDQCDLELEDLGKNHPIWREARAAIAAAGEWRPIAEADTSREIIALAIDGSVYRMDTHQNHRGEICWQTWMNAGFVDGYITHFVYLPTPPEDRHG